MKDDATFSVVFLISSVLYRKQIVHSVLTVLRAFKLFFFLREGNAFYPGLSLAAVKCGTRLYAIPTKIYEQLLLYSVHLETVFDCFLSPVHTTISEFHYLKYTFCSSWFEFFWAFPYTIWHNPFYELLLIYAESIRNKSFWHLNVHAKSKILYSWICLREPLSRGVACRFSSIIFCTTTNFVWPS